MGKVLNFKKIDQPAAAAKTASLREISRANVQAWKNRQPPPIKVRMCENCRVTQAYKNDLCSSCASSRIEHKVFWKKDK